MSRGEFGGGENYGSLSSTGRGVAGEPGIYQDGHSRGRFQSLCNAVSSNIFQINNNTSALERTLKQLVGGKDSFQLEKLHRIQQATNDLAGKTTSMLKQMSSVSVGSTIVGRQQHVQHERLKEEFRESISRYYSVQNKVAEKEKLLVGATRPSQTKQTGYEDDFVSERAALMEDDRRRQEQEQLNMQIDIDESLIREREERIRQIEGDILDINEIFRDLATMVYEQGDVVDSIEANVEHAHTNVAGANIQLGKASLYQRKARTKMCVLLLILVIVAGVVTLIIVLKK